MNAALLDYPNANPGDDPRLLAALRVIASAMYDAEMGVEQPKRKKPATGILKKKKPSYFIGMFFIGNLSCSPTVIYHQEWTASTG